MEQEKPNYYAIIPANIRYDNRLKDKAKLLYGEIAALANKYGKCSASNKYFAKLYDVDISTISRLIKNLTDYGYIKTTLVYKKDTKEIEKRYLQICLEGICKKVKDNKEEEYKEINKESNIIKLIENNLGRTISPIEYEVIKNWDYDPKVIELAIKESILNNAKTIKYIDRVLFNWEKNNIKTETDVKKYLEEFSNKIKSRNNKEIQPINYYKNLDE